MLPKYKYNRERTDCSWSHSALHKLYRIFTHVLISLYVCGGVMTSNHIQKILDTLVMSHILKQSLLKLKCVNLIVQQNNFL